MASLLAKRASFTLPLVPWVTSVIEGSQPERTHLGGFARGLGAGTLGLAGLTLGKHLDEYLSDEGKTSYVGRILGTLLGGLGGYKLGDSLLKAHNSSKENEHALREAEEEEKQASVIGGLVGAIDPDMSALGGATRGAGIEGGGLVGGGIGAVLGGLLGHSVGNYFFDDATRGAQVGAILGGVPGALIGGKIGWLAAKKMLQEHALAPEDNLDRSMTEEDS